MTSNHDRRGFLRAVGSVPIAAAVPATASVTDPADEAFRYWIAQVGNYNSGRRPDHDDNVDPNDCPVWEEFIAGPERHIYGLPPSIMAAAAIALVEASYAFDTGDTVHFDDTSMRILICIRPGLTGVLRQVADDLLDRQDGPYKGSLLGRGQRGREVMPWAA